MRLAILFSSSRYLPLLVLGGSGLLVAGFWLLTSLTFPRHTPAAILHYSTGIGIDYIGEGEKISVLPIAASALLIVNGLLWLAVRRASSRAAWIFLCVVPILVSLLLLAYVLLWRLNT